MESSLDWEVVKSRRCDLLSRARVTGMSSWGLHLVLASSCTPFLYFLAAMM
jgi:hypothetical protein